MALLLAWVAGDGALTGRVLLGAAIVVAAVGLTWAPAGGAFRTRAAALRRAQEA